MPPLSHLPHPGNVPCEAAAVRAEVAVLRRRGLSVCRIPRGEKNPIDRAWTTRSAEPGQFSSSHQVGILCGPLSHGNRPGHALVALDLDAPDAVALADKYLPVTPMVDGRAGKPQSHRYFLVALSTIPDWALSRAPQAAAAAVRAVGHPGPFNQSFRHRDTRREVLKFLGTGGQCVCPPSAHHSGERRAWDGGSVAEPAVVPFAELWDAVAALAAACGAAPPFRGLRRAPSAELFGGGSGRGSGGWGKHTRYSTCQPGPCSAHPCPLPPDVAELVRDTLPRGPGERNDRLWDCARALKTVLPGATPAQRRAAFELWWAGAVRVVRTRDKELSWRALEGAWPRALPVNPLTLAKAAADATDGPVRFKLLAGCRVLAGRNEHGRFELTYRAVGSILGVRFQTAAKHVTRLVADGLLVVASPDNPLTERRSVTMYTLGPGPSG